MSSEDKIKEIFEIIKQKIKEPKNQEFFSNFSKNIQFIFTDIDKTYLIRLKNGEIDIINGKNIETPDIQIKTEIKILNDIVNKKINPMNAYASGKLKAKGKLTDLLKIIRLL